MKKIGILGGTFNPVHNTHIRIAKTALVEGGLSEVWLMPAKIPPHKTGQDIVDGSHRYNMLKLALKSENNIFPSDFELVRESVSYTSDTLVALNKEFPNEEFFLIIGGDSVLYLEDWHEPQVIFDNCSILYVAREGSEIEKCENHIENVLKPAFHNVTISPFDFKFDNVSSTDIRNMIKAGCREYEKLDIPEDVLIYIIEEKLYI